MKVLLFAPHAGIVEHARAERDLSLAFESAGWDVTVVGCRGGLSAFCNVMAAKGYRPRDADVVAHSLCGGCRAASDRLFGALPGSARVDLDEAVTAQDWVRIEDLMAGARRESWRALSFNGLPVGRLAAYEFMLTYKLHDAVIPEELWPEYLRMLRPVLVSASACARILDAESPDRVVMYNSLYGVNAVWKRTAEAKGIPSFALQYNILAPRIHDFLMVYRDDGERCAINHSPEAAAALERPLTPAQVDLVHEALLANLRASNVFVYSKGHEGLAPEAIRARLGLDDRRPVVVLPLSSEDERFAAGLVDVEIMGRQPTTFPTQVDLVRHISSLASRRADLQFVVRLHPRMFPNRREGVAASAGSEILRALAGAPDNVRVNTPDQDLSLMDVAQVTSLCLAGRSTVGAQLSAFGIPLVVHDPDVLTAFPPSLGTIVSSADQVEGAIDTALRDPGGMVSVVRAYRWLAFVVGGVAVNLNPTGGLPEDPTGGDHRLPRGFRRTLVSATRSLPTRWQARLKGRSITLAALRTRVPDRGVIDLYSPVVRVISEERAFVPQVVVMAPGDVGDELQAVRASLAHLNRILGEFSDPSCLSTRIRRLVAD